jgi:anti-anti-sigma factor
MRIEVRRSGDCVTFRIVGPVDAESGPELSSSFDPVAKDPSIRHCVFDLSEVPAIASAGIGKLLRFHRRFQGMGGSMKIKGVSAPLRLQFSETHLDQIIPIED